jgi:hypothetical protein
VPAPPTTSRRAPLAIAAAAVLLGTAVVIRSVVHGPRSPGRFALPQAAPPNPEARAAGDLAAYVECLNDTAEAGHIVGRSAARWLDGGGQDEDHRPESGRVMAWSCAHALEGIPPEWWG